jgi:hypothetical protein
MFRRLNSKDRQLDVGDIVFYQYPFDGKKPNDYFVLEAGVAELINPTKEKMKERSRPRIEERKIESTTSRVKTKSKMRNRNHSKFLGLMYSKNEWKIVNTTYLVEVRKVVCFYSEDSLEPPIKLGDIIELKRSDIHRAI